MSYPSKKLLIKQRYIKTSSRWWVLLWKDYGWLLRDFRFFVKFHRSGPAIIFNSWIIMEHVSCPSKKILIKPRFIRTSSRWWVLLWKDYGCFLIELSIFNFSSNFTGPPAIIFNFWTITEQVSYPSKKLLIKQRYIKTSSRWWVLLWKDYGWFLRDFRLFVKFHRSGPAIIFNFWTHHGASKLSIKKAPNQAKIYQDLIKMVSVTLERLCMVSDRIVDFRFFVKFHRSGPAIIFNFWTITEHVSYPSKKLHIKPRFIRTSSRWWVLLWKDYGWFLIELSIFDFSSNFTGPDLQ